MGDFLMIMGVLLLVFGIPVGIFLTIFMTIKKKRFNVFTMSVPIAIGASIFLIIVGGLLSPTVETEENEVSRQEQQLDDKEEKKEKDKKDNQKQEKPKKEEPKEEKIQFNYDGVIVTYKEYKVTSSGEIIVYFEMENKSTETRSFDYTFDVYGWQKGIEMETNYFYDCNEEKNGSKDIKRGAKILVAEVFELNNTTDNVTIEIRPFFSFIDETLYEFEIELNK